MLILILTIYLFYLLHLLRRLLNHIHFCQERSYKCEKMQEDVLKNGGIKIYFESILALTFFVFTILLIRYINIKILFIPLFMGFGYFVYSALSFLTAWLSKKIPKITADKRNIIIAIIPIICALIPLFFSIYLYFAYKDNSDKIINMAYDNEAEIVSLLPEEQNGVEVIPIETVSLIIFFAYLFLIDLFLPILVAFGVSFTGLFFKKE